MRSGRSYWDFTEGQRSGLFELPMIAFLHPFAAFDTGQGLGRRGTGLIQSGGSADAANSDQIRVLPGGRHADE